MKKPKEEIETNLKIYHSKEYYNKWLKWLENLPEKKKEKELAKLEKQLGWKDA